MKITEIHSNQEDNIVSHPNIDEITDNALKLVQVNAYDQYSVDDLAFDLLMVYYAMKVKRPHSCKELLEEIEAIQTMLISHDIHLVSSSSSSCHCCYITQSPLFADCHRLNCSFSKEREFE